MKKAMKLALDALGEIEWSNNSQWQSDRAKVAITALREALADQPAQQEPVAYMYDRARYGPTDLRGQQWLQELSRLKPYTGNGLVRGVTPLYTAPQPPAQRTPLTDEQIKSMWRRGAIFGTNDEKAIAIARAIEAAHGIKENT